jgi:CRISPR-associated protein Cas2
MAYWVIYDISADGVRMRVANICKNYGLERVQKSAFLGPISKNRAEILATELERLDLSEGDCIFLLQACDSCIKNKIIFGHVDKRVFEEQTHLIIGGRHAMAYGD